MFPQLALAEFNRAAFEAKHLPEAYKALGLAVPELSAAIQITASDIAENGAVVPVGVATSLPRVKQLLILVDKNPSVLVAHFHLTDSVEPNITTRTKMAETSNLYAVAVTQDGKVYYAKKEVKVTLGGCGG